MPIIARESNSPVIGEIEALTRALEASKHAMREEEARYKVISGQILNLMVENKIEGSVSTLYGMVTRVVTNEYEYRDGEVTKQDKAVSVAKKTLDNLKKMLKAAQQIAINNRKAKIINTVNTLRYTEPK
jgi:methyl coenzyme M reductase subunit D